jgi:hypothetical protein
MIALPKLPIAETAAAADADAGDDTLPRQLVRSPRGNGMISLPRTPGSLSPPQQLSPRKDTDVCIGENSVTSSSATAITSRRRIAASSATVTSRYVAPSF